ncbi:MAG: alpha-glucosidase [Chloroflexi bacterium]|nr:alpha-glucosidase [Chloroflexota bacterium]
MTLKWWQTAVFYQIYPRSFADGNGDGIGDFMGMTAKLDTLKELGVDALWLSPHFPSPMWDCGYDISDYTSVAPEYGTLEDFKTFLEAAHRRGLRVILDLALNHTSDEHAWFLESKSSRDNPKADWYVWMDPLPPPSLRDASPVSNGRNVGGREGVPNNWQSCFDGPAWTYAPERRQYYYHYFMKQQPDLNWQNPAVKQAMWDAARFWLDLGVDGFRLDAIGTIYEHPDMPDHPVPLTLAEMRLASDRAKTDAERKQVGDYWREMFQYQYGRPGVHDLMKELRSILDEYDGDRMLVGEDDDVNYMGDGKDELHMVFNFPLMRADRLTPAHIRRNQAERLAALAKVSPQAWPCNTLGNHDSPRIHNRYGDGEHDRELARLSLATVLALKGTPFLYNGEEIGMTDFYLTDISQFKDTLATWYYREAVEKLGVDPAEALHNAARQTRDKCRTPMQWQDAPNGGFCPAGVAPWLPVNPDFAKGVNVADQRVDPASLWTFYQEMLAARKSNPALLEGDYLPLQENSETCLAFLRRADSQTCLVVLNFSDQPDLLDFSNLPYREMQLLFTSGRPPRSMALDAIQVDRFGVLIAEVA